MGALIVRAVGLAMVVFATVIAVWIMAMAILATRANAGAFDDYSMEWVLMEMSVLSPEPIITKFKSEMGCDLAESGHDEQGVEAFCVPVIVPHACNLE